MRQYRVIRNGEGYFAQVRNVRFNVEVLGTPKFLYRTVWQKIGLHGRSEFGLYDKENYSYPMTYERAKEVLVEYENKFYQDRPTVELMYDQEDIQWFIQNKKPINK